MKPARILAGRRESELLTLPSVQRMTEILARRCREESWIRTTVASLERFRALSGFRELRDLEALCSQAQNDVSIAEQALNDFACTLRGYSGSQISGLAMGPKIWFRLNGVMVPWRPLTEEPVPQKQEQQGPEQFILLALIGSGLRMAELLRLRVGDIGSLDSEGMLIPDSAADPLAVQHRPRLGKQGERITFLTFQARQALLAWLASTPAQSTLDTPLIEISGGTMSLRQSILRARRRNQALISAGSNVNVALCRATGDFFRSWGLPGSRFEGVDDLNIEEFF
ncbi:MAG TPA: hypothetical protein VL485_03140 [Ktedonobacteraceae bacterium]|jgi:hypothetical protein|nr:hypothetical protein [Ktedonobacteraceae bacterium]